MKRFSAFLQCMGIFAAMLSFAVCGFAAEQRSDVKNPLAVPAISLDENGLFTVEDCPTTHDVLEVDLYEGEYAINMVLISLDGLPMTTIPIEEDYGVTRNVVHFLDANFDGNVDILVGPGCNREYSVLIVWDNDRHEFVLATNDGFVVFNGNFYFDPQRKAVYRMTSSSAFETTCTMMTWQCTDLQSEVNFLQVFDPASYGSYRVTHRYTVRNYYSDEDVISTDDPSDISAPWNKWIETE
jgi:hypothetical protein